MPNRRSVLVISADPLLAALVAGVAESVHVQAIFPAAAESADQALERLRSLGVLLVSALDSESQSDTLIRRARRYGTRVMVFGAPGDIAARREWAASHDIPVFALPADTDALAESLRVATTPAKPPRVAPRGRSGRRFDDSQGTQWTIYDRRSRNRDSVERDFVSNTGEIRRCTISADEARTTLPEQIEKQLARAIRV